MTEWQPIETAPKDNSTILGTDGDHVQLTAWWFAMDGWCVVTGYSDMEPYIYYDDETGEAEKWDPIYWMPMPELPK